MFPPPHNSSARTVRSARVNAAMLGVVAMLMSLVVSVVPGASAAAAGPANSDWVGIINTYRAQSALAPVTANATWAQGAQNHSCWMLFNGIAHDEQPGTPGYTVSGDEAGNNGNVAVSSSVSATPRNHIDLWMSGPFHAIGILRPNLREAGYGMCANSSTSPWRSAATLDVLRGISGSTTPSRPVLFPGDGATTPLSRFVAESPDPRTFCGWSGRDVGLPLIALMPTAVSTASASLHGPNGAVATCVLTRSNTSGIAQSILGGDNAVVVVPAAPLSPGVYTATVNSNGGTANWSFTVDPSAPLLADTPEPPGTKVLAQPNGFTPITPFRFADSRSGKRLTRLVAGHQIRVKVAGRGGLPADITAVSANFTVAGPDGGGFLTASNCAADPPSVSTLNYQPNDVVPNQSIVPLDDGDLCLYSLRGTDAIIDINGYVSPASSEQFVAVQPFRVLDSRDTHQLSPGRPITLDLGSRTPSGATAVVLNLTGVQPVRNGWIRAFPCGQREPDVSSLNPRFTQNRANSAIVPLGASGSICLTSNVPTDVVADVTGWLGSAAQLEFVPLESMRLADTRSFHPTLNPKRDGQPLGAGQTLRIPVAGVRGVPSNAKAATVNLVSTGALERGWLRVVPCGNSSEVSNLNYSSPNSIANGANVTLDSSGALCVSTLRRTHVVVDITGVWV